MFFSFLLDSFLYLEPIYGAAITINTDGGIITKEIDVGMVVPQRYRDVYEETHRSLEEDISDIVKNVTDALNSKHPRIEDVEVRFQVNYQIITDHPVIDKIQKDPAICTRPTTYVTDLISSVNSTDNLNNYILFYPCDGAIYSDVFRSRNIPMPIIKEQTNIQCAARSAIFQEVLNQHLLSTLGNAILWSLHSDITDYSNVYEQPEGDKGITRKFSINDQTIDHIVRNSCITTVSDIKQVLPVIPVKKSDQGGVLDM